MTQVIFCITLHSAEVNIMICVSFANYAILLTDLILNIKHPSCVISCHPSTFLTVYGVTIKKILYITEQCDQITI